MTKNILAFFCATTRTPHNKIKNSKNGRLHINTLDTYIWNMFPKFSWTSKKIMLGYFTILVMTWLALRHRQRDFCIHWSLGNKSFSWDICNNTILHLELILARPFLSTNLWKNHLHMCFSHSNYYWWLLANPTQNKTIRIITILQQVMYKVWKVTIYRTMHMLNFIFH